ncbi:MAG: septum formation initiator family protein [Bacteroidota bacterium]
MDPLYYRKERSRWDPLRKALRNKRLVVALLVLVPLAITVVFGPRGLVQRVRFTHERAVLKEKIREAEAEGRRLRAEVAALIREDVAIEKVARERWGMARPGETVYMVRRK